MKTALLLAGLTILLVLMGRVIGGANGMIIGFLFALVMNVGSYWFSDKIVLSMYRAEPLTADQAPEFYSMVQRLCGRANLPMPALYVIPDPTPNAFATGRDPRHAAVAVHEGLLRLLDGAEVEGVIAHELAHIKNRDTLISCIAATIAGAITMLAHFARFAAIFGGSRDDDDGSPLALLFMAILAPIAALILQLAISRSREYLADRTGGDICGRPLALASALGKLEQTHRAGLRGAIDPNPATAHMFILNPLHGGGLMTLFSTHPPTAERIARLRAQAAGA
jgi:heat shock protein HtpX